MPQFTGGDGCQVLTPQRDASDTCPSIQYLPPSAYQVLYAIKKTSASIHNYRADAAATRVYYCTHALFTDYRTDATCVSVHASYW